MIKRNLYFILILIFLFISSTSVYAQINNVTKSNQQSTLTTEEEDKIESFIKKTMKKGKIPGASVVIVKDDKTLYSKGFGYANLKTKELVTSKTLFELGSDSKAFTALGILKLEKEGKIDLNDPVIKYIPWFKMKYSGDYRGKKIDEYVDITLAQLLYHTSGIPFKSIGDIPASNEDDALEKAVRTQVDKELDFYPGEKFLYATINYDILGLVIQHVSGESFEQYMKKNVLKLLELNNTYLSQKDILEKSIATGYKVQFLRPIVYDAPRYRGNTPAGYFITNAEDLAKWIKIQLGSENIDSFYKNLINISHVPDRTVAPNEEGASYASGWFVYQDGGGMICHGGSNPNFSSYILFKPKENIGIGVLANLDSSKTEELASGINDIIRGEKPKSFGSDIYISIDNISLTIVLLSLPFMIGTIYLLLLLLKQIITKQRRYIGNYKKTFINIFLFLLFILGFSFCIYNIPDVLFRELPWDFVKVWAPQSLLIAIVLLLISVIIFCVYFMLTTFFVKENEKALFIITALSIVSGFGNAIIIFFINETLNRNDGFQIGLLLFCIMGIVIYICGQRLIRIRLLSLTNELVYSLRIRLIENILNAPFEKVEQIESGKIHNGLNNDTETISSFVNLVISAGTSAVTLICCFIYLGIINLLGMLISILVITVAAGLYFIVGRHANRLWEETRDIQNVFFKFIDSLVYGFKELKLNNKRQAEFKSDIRGRCEEYRDKRIIGELGFANAFIIGELLFTLVIVVVAFFFPVIFKDIEISSLRNYILVFLYMTGPVNGVLNSIPNLVKVKISYNRVNDLIKELDLEIKEQDINYEYSNMENEEFKLELEDIEYCYKNSEGEIFKIGPINCSFKSGEVSFITGGNGSGKSTLAKVITGLYQPDNGKIYFSGNKVHVEKISQEYSAIFSDFYLFERLYGIDYSSNLDKIDKYLKLLRIEDKLEISDGLLSSLKLSTGQRKRVALLVSYLEDKSAYLFDEWAADQDPEFREFFYKILLPELKKRNKCIIAITHDDRYFNCADKVLRMEMGKLVSA